MNFSHIGRAVVDGHLKVRLKYITVQTSCNPVQFFEIAESHSGVSGTEGLILFLVEAEV